MLDQTLGAAGTLLCHSQEAKERLKLYGWAGQVRINPDIGTVEYRTLPAQALVQTPQLCHMIFEAASCIGAWSKNIYENSQSDFIKIGNEFIGSYDAAAYAARCVIDHDLSGCRDILERSQRFFNIPVLFDLQRYEMPNHFYLEGW
jgi:hypothetical protein